MGYGAVASGDTWSALAGRSALLEGGNAVDAIVATGVMAAVSLPNMTGLAGGGLLTIRMGDDVRVLDCFANVPGLGLEDRPRPEPEMVAVPFEDVVDHFAVGPASVAVPGVVAGLWEVHRRYGRMPLADLIAPAIAAARDGVIVQDAQYKGFCLLQGIFRRSPETWAMIGDENGVLQVGMRVKNPSMADTLEQLLAEGPRAFYEGDIARALVEGTEGWVTETDLARYEVVWRTPLEGRYRGRRVFTPGIPSMTGPLLLASLDDLQRGPPLPAAMQPPDWERLADALRHGEALRTSDYEQRAHDEGFLEGVVAASKSGCTMHASTVDADGNVASYSSTMGENAGRVAPGTGLSLNNFLGEADILPEGVPLVAGTRMRSAMCPMVLEDEAGRWMAVGSAGSRRIRSATLQVLVHAIDGGLPLQQAVGRPRIHVEEETLYVEGYGRTPEDVEALRPYGLPIVTTWAPGFYFGGAQAVARTADGFDAGAEIVRRGGAAHVV